MKEFPDPLSIGEQAGVKPTDNALTVMIKRWRVFDRLNRLEKLKQSPRAINNPDVANPKTKIAGHTTRSEASPATGNTMEERFTAEQERKRLAEIKAKKSWWQRRNERNQQKKAKKEKGGRNAKNKRQTEIAANRANNPDHLVYNHSHKGLLVFAVLGVCSLLSVSSFIFLQPPPPIDQPPAPPLAHVENPKSFQQIPDAPRNGITCENSEKALLQRMTRTKVTDKFGNLHQVKIYIIHQGLKTDICANNNFFTQ